MVQPFAVSVGLLGFLFLLSALWLTRNHEDVAPQVEVKQRIAAFGLLVGSVAVFIAHGSNGVLQHDEAVFVVTNIEVANGHLPYTRAFDNTGPLGPWFGGLGVYLGRQFGTHDLFAARIAYLPVALATVFVTFVLARKADIRVVASLIGAATLVMTPSFSREALSGPRPKLLVVLLGTFYVYALAQKRYWLAGALVALSTLAWQASFVLILVPIIHTIWRGLPSQPIKASLLFLAGGLAPTVIVALVFAGSGELEFLIEGFFTWNVGLGASRLPSSVADAFANPLKDLWGAHQAMWPLLVLGAAAILPVARKRFGGYRSYEKLQDGVSDLTTVAFLVWVAWTLIDYQGVVDLFPFLPFVAFGAAKVADVVAQRSRIWTVALFGTVLILGGVDLVRTRNDGLRDQEIELASIAAEHCVASYGQPEALAILGQSNPSRFFFSVPGLEGYLGRAVDSYVQELVIRRPVYIGGPVDANGSSIVDAVAEILPAIGYAPITGSNFEGWVTDKPGC